MRLHLQRLHLDVDVADDGRMACDMVEQAKQSGKPYNLIFMDIQMPRMNGYEATQRLRQQGYQMPIVALTAHALAGDREKCLAAGCDDYLAKPVFISGLREILWKYLGRPAAPPGQLRDAAVPPSAQTCPEIDASTASVR
jgi:CheY-like chemotaxis protein